MTTLSDGMNSSNRIRVNLRYCDSSSRHHISCGNTCAFASPIITSLVPQEQRHLRVRDGLECNHFSFDSIRSASLQARILNRFDSIENDRQENMIEILNKIDEKTGDSNELIRMIASQIDIKKTSSKLLKIISNAFKIDGSFTEMGRNTTLIAQHTADVVNESQKLKEDLNAYHLENTSLLQNSFDKLIELNGNALESLQRMVGIVTDMSTKISSITEYGVNDSTIVSNIQEINDQLKHGLDVNEVKELKEKFDSHEMELSLVKYELQLINISNEKNDIGVQQKFSEIKVETKNIKDEILLLKEDINSLPNKLMSSNYSFYGSDVELFHSDSEND